MVCCKEIKSPTNDDIFNHKKATTVSHPKEVLDLRRVAKVYLGILLNAMAIEANRVWNGSTLILRWTTWRLQEAGKSLIHLKNLQWGSRRRKPPTFYTSLSEFRGNTYPMVSQLTGSTWLHFRSFRSCHLMLTCHHHIFISRGYHPVTRLLGKMAARMHARDFGNKLRRLKTVRFIHLDLKTFCSRDWKIWTSRNQQPFKKRFVWNLQALINLLLILFLHCLPFAWYCRL